MVWCPLNSTKCPKLIDVWFVYKKKLIKNKNKTNNFKKNLCWPVNTNFTITIVIIVMLFLYDFENIITFTHGIFCFYQSQTFE